MPAPYVTGARPDLDRTLQTAKTLDRHLADAIAGFAPTEGRTTMTTSQSFAASLRAITEAARADAEQARADAHKQVVEAVAELKQASAATAKVAGTMAQQIKDEAAAVLSDLGQISNDL